MLTPVLRTLRKALPEAEITLLTSSQGSQVAPLLPWVDHVMVYPELWRNITKFRLLDLRKDRTFIEQLREQRFSMAMIFTSLCQSPWVSAYACYLAGIPQRVGYAADVHSSALSHFLLPPADDFHQVDRNLNLLETLGIYETDNQVELSISEDIEQKANELLIENGIEPDIPYTVLAPGSSYMDFRYEPHCFAAAARILSAQTELQLVIVGGVEELEIIQPVLQRADENLYGNVHSLVGKITLPELAAVIRRASLTITNRSAAMHIAEVFNCPMVVLYPETDTNSSWNPRSPSTRVLSRPDSCSVCYESACQFGMKCLDIRPQEVAITALEMLGEQAYPSTTYHVLQEYKSEM